VRPHGVPHYGRYDVSITFHRPLTRFSAVGAALALALGVAACGASGPADSTADSATGQANSSQPGTSDGASPQGTTGGAPAALTIYTGQHEDLVKDLAAQFTETTGIAVTIRAGDDASSDAPGCDEFACWVPESAEESAGPDAPHAATPSARASVAPTAANRVSGRWKVMDTSYLSSWGTPCGRTRCRSMLVSLT
jgi:hypothetical protein